MSVQTKSLRMKLNFFALIFLGNLCITQTFAQDLDANNRVTVVLSDGVKVELIGKAMPMGSTVVSNDYYYLPTNLHLATRPDGTPQFLFVKYTTDKEANAGGIQGAIIHFLMEWGLSDAQRKEAQTKLNELLKSNNAPKYGFLFDKIALYRDMTFGQNARILGAIDLLSNEGSFKIISAILSDVKAELKDAKIVQSGIIQSGKAPTSEGSKAIVAAKMDKNSAQLLAATLDKAKSIGDISLQMDFNYHAKIPAVKGNIQIDWQKVKASFDSYYANKKYTNERSGFMDLRETHTFDYNEFGVLYKICIDSKAVVVNIDLGGRTAEEQATANKIGDLFMQTFANFIADKTFADQAAHQDSQKSAETRAVELQQQANGAHNYTINVTKVDAQLSKGHHSISLDQRMNSTFATHLSGNIMEWYGNAKKFKDKCIYSVNLNDPFYEHRKVNFVLDLDAKDIFDKEINYVTVNVRKQRDKGNPFSDRLVIDKKYLNENGSNSVITYARGEDSNPDVFEYQTQWSLRGGHVVPPAPLWQKGDWAGMTLAAPVQPRLIEFEADLEKMKAMDMKRATLQIRYKKFGEEIEENIHVSPAQGQALVNKTIFTDKDSKGYMYRLIFNHATEGKLALDWVSKANDNYVFATIPTDFNDKSSKLFREAKDLGERIKSFEGKVPDLEHMIPLFEKFYNLIKK